MEIKTAKKAASAAGMAGLCAILFVGALCGKEDRKTTDVDEKEIWQQYAKEPVTLDWYVNYSWFTTPWGNNVVSEKITEETGVTVHFITPMGNETEKLNALIASDSLPDLITIGYWEPQVKTIIDSQMVYSLNELAEDYDIYFWKDTKEDVVKWYTMEDGNIYGYPCSATTLQDYEEEKETMTSNQTFVVRKDIYEAIGSPDMSTQEGFLEAVEKAVEMFPEVNGEKLIPVGAHVFDNEGNPSFDKYLMNWLVVAIMLIVVGIAFIAIEMRNQKVRPSIVKFTQLSYKTAFIIGVFQLLALIPGTSRSGITIIGGMLFGCSRFIAAEYTFYLAIPVMFGASGLKLVKFLAKGGGFSAEQFFVVLLAMVVSYGVSMIVIKFLMQYIKRHNFNSFALYRIALGIIVLIVGFAVGL